MPCFYDQIPIFPLISWLLLSVHIPRNVYSGLPHCCLKVLRQFQSCQAQFSLSHRNQAQYLNLFPQSWFSFCLFWVWLIWCPLCSKCNVLKNNLLKIYQESNHGIVIFLKHCLKQVSTIEIFLLCISCFTKIQVTWKEVFKWEVTGKSEEKCFCHQPYCKMFSFSIMRKNWRCKEKFWLNIRMNNQNLKISVTTF